MAQDFRPNVLSFELRWAGSDSFDHESIAITAVFDGLPQPDERGALREALLAWSERADTNGFGDWEGYDPRCTASRHRPSDHEARRAKRRLREHLDALGPAPRAELFHVLMLSELERVDLSHP